MKTFPEPMLNVKRMWEERLVVSVSTCGQFEAWKSMLTKEPEDEKQTCFFKAFFLSCLSLDRISILDLFFLNNR